MPKRGRPANVTKALEIDNPTRKRSFSLLNISKKEVYTAFDIHLLHVNI